MPIKSGRDSKGFYYKYGDSGTKYYYKAGDDKGENKAYMSAVRQAAAINISKNKK